MDREDLENEIDELQNDEHLEGEEELEDEVEESELQQASDSATDSVPEHDKKAEGGQSSKSVNQDAINEAIARQHAKYREEQRRAQALEQKLFELQSQMQPQQAPQVPDVPDRYDFDSDAEYREAIKRRDEAIIERKAWEERQRQQQQYLYQHQQQAELQRQQQRAEAAQAYAQRAKELKVNPKELEKAGQIVGAFGIQDEVFDYILNDDKGALITTALAKNPQMLEQITSMPAHQAVLYIERNVTSKLNARPRVTQANKPPTRVKGKSPSNYDRFPLTGGATVD